MAMTKIFKEFSQYRETEMGEEKKREQERGREVERWSNLKFALDSSRPDFGNHIQIYNLILNTDVNGTREERWK